MAVAIALAYSLEKMKNEHNLVKNINSSETMEMLIIFVLIKLVL